MKVKVSMWELKDAIKKMKGVLSGNITVDVLKNMLVVTDGSSVKLCVYDFWDYLELRLTTGEVIERGKILIDKDTLLLIDKIKAKIPDRGVTITDNKITYENKEITFALDNYGTEEGQFTVDDFPEAQKCNRLVFVTTQEELKRLLDVSYVCDKKQDIRPLVQGICIDNDYFVATDTYRIAKRKVEFENKITKPVMIHMKSVELLMLLLKEPKEDVWCWIDEDNKNLRFEFGDIKHTIRLMDEKFVTWRDLIYPEPKTTVTLDTKEALNELNLVKALVSKGGKDYIISISVENNVMNVTGEVGAKKLSVDIPVEQSGENMDYTVYLNCVFLIEMLKQQGETAKINFAGNNYDSVVIGKDDLLMSIKMDN